MSGFLPAATLAQTRHRGENWHLDRGSDARIRRGGVWGCCCSRCECERCGQWQGGFSRHDDLGDRRQGLGPGFYFTTTDVPQRSGCALSPLAVAAEVVTRGG